MQQIFYIICTMFSNFVKADDQLALKLESELELEEQSSEEVEEMPESVSSYMESTPFKVKHN